jgi:polyribonucleotide nucleotidyltransferase
LGHGALAERALKTVLPTAEQFPYTIRVVSEILESNGSSSMASVCAGSMALMDSGVPISAPVSGIAMGLLIQDSEYVILSDIQGLEDHYGDMDFKVAGTQKGVTALQLDIKVSGLSEAILTEALAQALKGRMHILSKMMQVISAPRGNVAPNAPKIEFLSIDPSKVGLLIGPGGKMIRKIEEDTRASVVVTDGSVGAVCVSAKNQDDLDAALAMINALVRDVQVGDEYTGKVTKIMAFGAFIELVPGKEGLAHISTLSTRRLGKVEEVLKVGDSIPVRVKEIDAQHRINLVPITPFE